MKKRLLGIFLATTMMATLFAGCGSAAAETPAATTESTATETTEPAAEEVAEAEDTAQADAAEPVTLKWAIWDKDITPYWEALKEAYEAANPNVTVEMTDLGSTDYMTVLATELSGSGSDFDVVTIKDVPGYATLVSKNTLEPLDSYISSAGIDLSQYGGVDKQVTVNGSLYELPFRNDFWVVFYNKDIFDAAGVDYPTNDMTFDEYDALARQVADPTFGAQVYGTHYHTWRSAVQLFGVLDGKHTILDGNYDFFKPYYEMVLKQEDDQICRNYADLSAEGLHYSAAFSGGDVAMMNMGSWFISTLMANIASGEYDASLCGNWGMVKYPHADGVEAGSTLGTITGLAVTSVSEQKQAAFDFVNWVSSAEGAKVMAETGNFPALMNAEVAGIISGLDGFPQDDTSKEALNVSNLYLEVPYAENVSAINDILDTYHKSIMNREMTVDEGIAAMNDEVGKVLGQ
ncbi:multiple sugar transport system substrate-binding protein [Kineothrix alysoides]|uniref:Multiple sugar transport system substrate-binding protein n=1 Tax=Kineothrix alysoides TaxID=1469948 RepID=A0A4R1QTK2_9FIRM|nr:sugar ABC transporter substrate-binding protein [Kineothrix alysoides]TCL57188.1 multiple sugar transport system substrate-binding protein [Kineothrix alysoides]